MEGTVSNPTGSLSNQRAINTNTQLIFIFPEATLRLIKWDYIFRIPEIGTTSKVIPMEICRKLFV